MEKVQRGANFTKTEIDLLIDIALKYKHIIENKKTDATTWKDKNDAWEKICNEFNAASGNFPRSTKTIRAKYDTIKKNIRKKCSLLKSEQTKTGGGQCSITLTPYEEKVVSLTPNTMIGLESRFDKDSVSEYIELGTSESRQWATQQNIEDEPGPSVEPEENIEFINDENYNLFQFFKTTENMEVPKAKLISPEKSTNTKKTYMKRTIDAVDSVHEKKTRKGTDANKFIFKNKRVKLSTENSNNQIMQENFQLKNEILVSQKDLLLQEIKDKSEITKLTIENLKLDTEIKRLTLQKLQKGECS